MRRIFLSLLLVAAASVVVTACAKKRPQPETQSETDQEIAEAEVESREVVATDEPEEVIGPASERKKKPKKKKVAPKTASSGNQGDSKLDPDIEYPKPVETLGDAVASQPATIEASAASRELSEEDRAFADDAEARAVDSAAPGARVTWKNPDSGTSGEIRPGVNFKQGGTSCRRYTHTITVDGEIKSVTGTLCKGADGVWRAQ